MTRDELILQILDEDIQDEPTLSADVQREGILKALRVILRCEESDSILIRAIAIMRRGDALCNEHGHAPL